MDLLIHPDVLKNNIQSAKFHKSNKFKIGIKIFYDKSSNHKFI